MKPLTDEERKTEKNKFWTTSQDSITQTQTKETYNFGNFLKSTNFYIDKVYNDEMTTGQIFDSEAKQLVLSSLDGYNVTIFAYGQTASGKTFTMRGNNQQQGIIPLALSEIFQNLNEYHGASYTQKDPHYHTNDPRTWNVKVSYLEIYNECVNDLLDPTRRNLDVRESRQRGIYIDRLSEFEVSSLEETMNYLLRGDEQRAIAETKLNEKSSRSHTVFQIDITMREKNFETGKMLIRTSRINLVDLAGSEGVNKTKSEGVRFREGTNINKSLLALSTVIYRLSQKYQQTAKNYFINFRDSKLTRILQQPLSGNSQTAIICTMSQIHSNYAESRETLNFGARAKNIKTYVNVNEVLKESAEELVTKLQQVTKENEDLRKKLKIQEDFEKTLENNQEDFSSLGYLKSYQDYMIKLLDEKSDIILELEKQVQKLQDQNDENAQKMETLEQENIKINEKHLKLIEFNEENLLFNEHLMNRRIELEQQVIDLKANMRINEIQQQVQRFSLDNTMNNLYDVNQGDNQGISESYILSNKKSPIFADPNQDMQQDVLYLMQENEKLKSTIQFLKDSQEELDLQYQQTHQLLLSYKDQLQTEKDNNLRLMQNYRGLRLETKKKDKYISQKNFIIQGMCQKMDLLEKSNNCLFKELDNTISGVSLIENDTQNEINMENLNIDENRETKEPKSGLKNKTQFMAQSLKTQIMELTTKVEILQNEKMNLQTEVDTLTADLEEAEKNIYELTMNIKNMHYDIEEIEDINEELQNDKDSIEQRYMERFKQMEEETHLANEENNTLKHKNITQSRLISDLQTEIVEKDRLENDAKRFKLNSDTSNNGQSFLSSVIGEKAKYNNEFSKGVHDELQENQGLFARLKNHLFSKKVPIKNQDLNILSLNKENLNVNASKKNQEASIDIIRRMKQNSKLQGEGNFIKSTNSSNLDESQKRNNTSNKPTWRF
ncbi:kinesin-like protein [Stylonychia lemnae]|uniref:Kinesin-like protein n=1 Tax=Stylonychia lemnae TaxID=5949 RepID=A0A078B624_STYLE|nr:kinesin-like protein [Stylonychia lemnae]|eukprot:CDW89864.1 kinesin-like protein [Stylonychia lemnae]